MAAMFSLSLFAWAKDKQTAPDLSDEASVTGSIPTDATTSAFLIAADMSVTIFAPAS